MSGTFVSVLLAQNNVGDGGGIGGMLLLLIELAILVAVIAGVWKTFEKAGQPGWAAIVPIYNITMIRLIAGFCPGVDLR